ncbi:MAG: hypothetical protein AAGF56_13735 [Pseudomonadota bacterium]
MARILLLEDDLTQSLEIAEALRDVGHDVRACTTAGEARSEILEQEYDLLIADLIVREDGKPVPDGGLYVIGWVRRNAAVPEAVRTMPIVAISGTVNNPGMAFALTTAEQVGATVSLPKPLNMRDLVHTVGGLTEALPPR